MEVECSVEMRVIEMPEFNEVTSPGRWPSSSFRKDLICVFIIDAKKRVT